MIHWLLSNGWYACDLIPLLGERAAGDAEHVTCSACLGVALVPARHAGARPTGTGWPA